MKGNEPPCWDFRSHGSAKEGVSGKNQLACGAEVKQWLIHILSTTIQIQAGSSQKAPVCWEGYIYTQEQLEPGGQEWEPPSVTSSGPFPWCPAVSTPVWVFSHPLSGQVKRSYKERNLIWTQLLRHSKRKGKANRQRIPEGRSTLLKWHLKFVQCWIDK